MTGPVNRPRDTAPHRTVGERAAVQIISTGADSVAGPQQLVPTRAWVEPR